jgi:acyl-CoA hydrolase
MQTLRDVEACVDQVLARVGHRVRLGTPLGIGKPNHLLNAFYRRAKADPSIDLHILTALTLERPRAKTDLERRFLEPFAARVFGDYPELEYERDREAGALPSNVRVIEFYFLAGKLVGNAPAQRDYISTNYTFVARDLIERGVNVLAQQVCRGERDGREVFSLSSNPDVTPDLIAGLRAAGRDFVTVAQVNDRLPFMHGDAVTTADAIDLLVDDPSQYCDLFCTPKTAVSDADYLIGLYASTLIKDGGELQIGIGSLGDALVYALELRHKHNALYREVLDAFGISQRYAGLIERHGGTGRFERGLFSATEMLVDGFMHLIDAGIVRRKVYDDVPLQRLLNEGRIGETVTAATLDALCAQKAIGRVLDAADVAYLQHWGVLRSDLSLRDGQIVLADGTAFVPDLGSVQGRTLLAERCLGSELRHGAIVHAAFFLGPGSFYRWLRELPERDRALISMRSVGKINQLYGHEPIDRLHRRDARFVNTGMMVTLLGAVVSDGLDNGQVVSGVGGQYNFVAMAHALPGGRSVLQVRSTRHTHGELSSNVVWNYGHTTIARHLRDLVITEYGIADLRAKTDGEVIAELLAVSDARFSRGLCERAQREGKLDAEYRLPAEARDNLPSHYAPVLARFRRRGLFPEYPFGTEFTAEELVLMRALRGMQAKVDSAKGAIEALADAVVEGGEGDDVRPYLERMQLLAPQSLKDKAYQRLLAAELRQVLARRSGA